MRRASARGLRSAELARQAGVSPDTLRHYERKGVLPKAPRSANGYREYAADAGTRVRLVRRALALGFTLDEIARILAVRDRGGAPCRAVRALAEDKLSAIESRLGELLRARESLQDVMRRWDALLDAAPGGGRANLLDALQDLVEPGTPSPLVPPTLRRNRKGSAG